MAISLTEVDELQEHLLGVFKRSDHHAGEVNEVLLSLSGAILWRKKPGDPIKVNTKEGAGGNVIWFRVDGTRYALLYSHEERFIKLMAGGRKGELVSTFTNATPTAEVARIFAGLGNGIAAPSESKKVRKEDRDPDAPKVKVAKTDNPAKAEKVAAKKLRADRPKKPKDRAAKEARLKARDEKVRQHREDRKAARQASKAGKAAEAVPPEELEDPADSVEAPVAGTPPRLRAVEPAAATGS
ncbi:MAG: hypothetical protein ACOZJX_06990 [Pseudomonadota bacterium]